MTCNLVEVIPFNQADIISKLDPSRHKDLVRLNSRFNGLCELICNRILIDDSLERDSKDPIAIQNSVTLEKLDEKKIKKSHLIDIYSIFRKVLAYLFRVYPDNILSRSDQWKLVKKTSTDDLRVVNRKILEVGLDRIQDNEIIKLQIFSKDGLSFTGHSLLIKKMSKDQYIFFNPNSGEHRNLSFCQLSDNIDEQLDFWKGTDVVLIKGKTFLERLRNKLGKNINFW